MLQDDDLEYEGQSSPETNVIIDPIDGSEKSLTYGLYSQLGALENFYSSIQNIYKRITLTWLIAALTAMGFLFSQKPESFPISLFYILMFVFFVAMWSITLLWFLDITVYQTYFFGVVTEQLKLELENDWLPNINRNFLKMGNDPQKVFFQSCFYIGCYYILLTFMLVICLDLIHFYWLYSIFMIVGFVFIGWLIGFVMYIVEVPKKSPVNEKIKKLINK